MLWFVGVAATAGYHLWNETLFDVRAGGIRVELDLEGMSDPQAVAPHVRVTVIPFDAGAPLLEVLALGLRSQYPVSQDETVPAWWLRPIYCGWGDQVAYALAEEGAGPERRALAYCIQGLYERWLSRLDAAGVPVGTVIIDAGWSPTGVWVPDEIRWPDLKGFIHRQHEAGRKVLLWIGLWIWDGLDEALSMKGDGRQWCADPGHCRYRETIRRWVHDLLSPEGFNADGFKLDQLGHCPNRRKPRWGPRFGFHRDGREVREVVRAGEGWGIELLHRYQKTIYDAAKAARPDALITSSTVHPYFRNTFDMVRLHDMGGNVPDDLLAAMKARADVARAALPGFPIDTDDWVHGDYPLWLDYTVQSHRLGVPCLFYSERFVARWDREPTTLPITDLDAIANAWKRAGYAPAAGFRPDLPDPLSAC